MAKVAAAGVEGGGGGEPDFEVGFRFRPTEVELVDFYLRRRAQGDLTIPKSFIRELDIYERRPWRLPHHLFPYCNAEEREMYFFTRRRRASGNSSKRFSRAVDEGGLWDGHAAGKPIYKAGQAGGGGERVRIGHRAQLAFKLFDDRRNKKSTQWILHEYRLVDDRADDVVLCRIHRRKGEGEGEGEEVAPAINGQQRVDAVAAADADVDDDDEDDDLSFAQLLEGELMEAEEEERRAKRQRTEEEDHQTSTSQPKRQRTERGEGHQASAADTDDGLTMSLDEINAILDDLPSDAPRRRSVDPLDIEQLLECLEAEPLASFDDMLRETLSPAAEEMVPATRDCLSPPLPAFAADEHCYDLQALGVRGDFVF